MPERKPNPPTDLRLYADIGDAVEWYAGGDPTLTPIVGIVIAKSPGFAPGTSNLTLATYTGTGTGYRDGVLHMSNDRCRRQGNPGGGWRHRPIDFAFKQFMLAVGALVWDDNENYVANEEFDAIELGLALCCLLKPPSVESLTPRSGQSPPPPVPPA